MGRSPNYPSLTLPEAIADIRRIHERFQKAVMTPEEVMGELGYKSMSGPARTRLSAFKKYGLIESSGKGWRVTDRGRTLAVRSADAPQYQEAVVAAVKDVELFADLLRDHRDSSEALLREHLEADLGFTRDGAAKAVEAFLAAKGLVSEGADGTLPADEEPTVKPGDYVQWTSQGVAQFATPRQVVRIDEHAGGKFAAVVGDDGKEGWVPLNQLTVEQPGAANPVPTRDSVPRPQPPVIVAPARGGDVIPQGMEESRWKLPSGHAVLRYPPNMTASDFKVLERQVALLRLAFIGEDDDEAGGG